MTKRAYARTQAQRKLPTVSEPPSGLLLPTSLIEQDTAPIPYPSTAQLGSAGHDFAQIPVHPAPSSMPQLKPGVTQAGDAHEREADHIARQVMRMPDSARANAGDTVAAPAHTETSAIPGSGGQPLDTATRAFMEPRFGHDFSQVRVHTDEQAANAAAGMQARAYTVGSDIVFGAHEYAPDTTAGRHLLAHELTHVVQQEADVAPAGVVQRAPLEAAPAAGPAVAEVPAVEKTDEELAAQIMDKQLAILAGWQGALARFDKVLTSSSDKEAKPDFAKVIVDFLGEEIMGEMLKHSKPPASQAFALLGKLDAEVKRAQAADVSASVRDFFVRHLDAITKLVQATLSMKEDFVARVRKTREAMEMDATASTSPKKGRKPTVEVLTTNAADEYGMMRMNLVDTIAEMDARLKMSTPERLFLLLSEEWIRHATVTGAWGVKYPATVIIRIREDYTMIDAHIQGPDGQKIAEQLLKDNPDGVDVFNLPLKREIKMMAANGWPSAILDLDENNHNINRGSFAEGNYDTVQRYVLANGLPKTKKLEGD